MTGGTSRRPNQAGITTLLVAELDAVAGRDHHREAGQHDQRRDAADRRRPAEQHRHDGRRQRRQRSRRSRRIGARTASTGSRTITGAGSRRVHGQPTTSDDQHRETGMRGDDERHLPQPGGEIVDHGFRRAQPHQVRQTALVRYPRARADAGTARRQRRGPRATDRSMRNAARARLLTIVNSASRPTSSSPA